MQAHIVVLGGDGIGPEVTAQAVRVLQAVAEKFGHRFSFEEKPIGGIAIDQFGTALPAETLEACKKSDAVLLGGVGGPKWDNPKASVRPEQGLLAIRKGLGLFANLRPVKVHPLLMDASPIKPEILRGTDFIVIRELTGGIYFGQPQGRSEENGVRSAVDTCRYTEGEIERVLRIGFELARNRKKKLTSVDKQNVMASSRLWREVALEMAKQYPDVEVEHLLVDACAMHLIRRPASFDVIVTENLFGDILTDEAAVLAGSMGMLPSASLGAETNSDGRRLGLYEPIHGTAPDIAGKAIANPLAAILSAALLLRYSCNLETEAKAVEQAVDQVLAAGYRSQDIKGNTPGEKVVGTEEMGNAVLAALSSK